MKSSFLIDRKSAATLALVSLLALQLAAGCGGSAISSMANPPAVSAQQSYSNASLSGVYSLNESGTTGGQLHDGSGTLQFDGNGTLTGSLTYYYVGGSPCQFSITGTYSVTSSASGTANLATTTTNPACTGETGTVSIQVAQQGQSVVFAESDGLRIDSGIALKQ